MDRKENVGDKDPRGAEHDTLVQATEERFKKSILLSTKDDDDDIGDEEEQVSRQRGAFHRKGDDNLACGDGANTMTPGAVAVGGSNSSHPNVHHCDIDGDNTAEVETTTSSATVYMVHATPVEEIVATEVVAEETAAMRSIPQATNPPHDTIGDTLFEQDDATPHGTKQKSSHAINLRVETVNFDEQAFDEEIGPDISANNNNNEDPPKQFQMKRHHYVLAVIIVLVYLLLSVIVIFGLAVGEEDNGDKEDVCEKTKALVLNHWQNLKGLALCGYVFACTILFAMIFEWRRYERDVVEQEYGKKVIPLICSRAAVLKQFDNRLMAVVYLLLHLVWFFFSIAVRLSYEREGLDQFWEDISRDCPQLDKPNVPSLPAFNAIITFQLSLLLYPIGFGIAKVFLAKNTTDSASNVGRRKVRLMLQVWFVDLVLCALATVSLFVFIFPAIEQLQEL